MHVWTLLQHTMIVFYVLRRTTVHKGYVTPVLLRSLLFVNKVLKKVLELMKMNTHGTPFCKYGLK